MRAEQKGWIPIIVPNPPAQEDSGTWYDFFKGMSDIPVEEALQGKNVVNATVQGMIYKRYNRKNIKRRNEVYSRIALSRKAQEFVDARLSDLMKNIQVPTVAVRYRGTDYRVKGKWCPTGQAKVPDISDFIATVEKDLSEWHLNSAKGENIFSRRRSKRLYCRFSSGSLTVIMFIKKDFQILTMTSQITFICAFITF